MRNCLLEQKCFRVKVSSYNFVPSCNFVRSHNLTLPPINVDLICTMHVVYRKIKQVNSFVYNFIKCLLIETYRFSMTHRNENDVFCLCNITLTEYPNKNTEKFIRSFY